MIHTFTFSVPGLSDHQTILLLQANCQIEDDLVTFDLEREDDESRDDFMSRGSAWIALELSRLNVCTGKLLKAEPVGVEPVVLGGLKLNVAAAWTQIDQAPPAHNRWSDPAAAFRLSLWDAVTQSEDLNLQFAMMDSICESAGVMQEWEDRTAFPPRFAEVRLLRNLLIHGSVEPNMSVREYIENFTRDIVANRVTDRRKHMELARVRAPHLKAAVWQIVMNDCVGEELNLHEQETAGAGGIILESQGPYPMSRGILGAREQR